MVEDTLQDPSIEKIRNCEGSACNELTLMILLFTMISLSLNLSPIELIDNTTLIYTGKLHSEYPRSFAARTCT